jgi:hypothetical protein
MAASGPSASADLAGFIARYDPAVQKVAKAALTKLRRLLPGACELVYDNYNALAIGFGTSERASDVIASIALYPRWVSLFFMHGARLSDPKKLLKGSGSKVRHIVLESAAVLDSPAVKALCRTAVAGHPSRLDAQARRRVVVKSVSAKQRPRRPERS